MNRYSKLAAGALVCLIALPVAGQDFTFVEESFRLPDDPEPRLTDTTDVDLVDVDADGDLDLFIVEGTGIREGRQNRLLINDGFGVFDDQSAARLPTFDNSSQDAEFGDVDGDGDLDIFVANTGPNQLLLNDGAGFFSDVSATQLPAAPNVIFDVSLSVRLFDINGDGDLDALIANEVPLPGNPGSPNRILANTGGGIFVDRTLDSIGFQRQQTRGIAVGDIDEDGDLDWIAANGGQDDVWINNGDGTFSDETALRFPVTTDPSRDAELADLDDDGDLDLYIVNSVANQNRLYFNNGAGFFSDETDRLPSRDDTSLDVELFDVDGDGDIDAYVSNSGPRSGPPDPPPHTFDGERNRLLMNDGNGFFNDDTADQLPNVDDPSFSAALGDLDGDGLTDLVVGNAETGGEERLYVRRERVCDDGDCCGDDDDDDDDDDCDDD